MKNDRKYFGWLCLASVMLLVFSAVCAAEDESKLDISVPYIVNDGPPDPSLFAHPYSVTTNESGDIFVADTKNNRIVKLIKGDPANTVVFPTKEDLVNIREGEDQLQAVKTNAGTQDEQVMAYMLSSELKRLLKPQGVATYQNLVFVADSGSGRVVVLEDMGTYFKFVRDYGSFMNYGHVRDIAVDAQGSFYIVDGQGGRIFKFSKDGVPWSFGSNKPAIEGFLSPYGLTLDAQGNIYVADTSNNRVVKFNPQGEQVLVIGEKGKAPGKLFFPHDVTIDNEGSIYIADCENYRIQKFDSNGNFVGTIGEWGKEKGGFFHLRKIAFTQRDGKNLILAVDSTLMRVQGIEVDPFIKIEHEPLKLINSNPFLIQAEITTKQPEAVTARIEYKVNDGALQSTALPLQSGSNYQKNLQITGLQTNHIVTYRIVATSQSGRTNFTEYFKTKVDLTPPVISSFQPENNHIFGVGDIVISSDYYDVGTGIDTSKIVLKIDGAPVTPQEITANSLKYSFTTGSAANDGSHAIFLEISDQAGLKVTKTWNYVVDRTPPQAQIGSFRLLDFPDNVITNASANPILSKRANIIGTITDAHMKSYTLSYAAGVNPVESAFNEIATISTTANINNASLYYWNTANLTDGIYTLRVVAQDQAGNKSSPSQIAVELDNTAPKGAIISPFFSQVITDLTAPGGNVEVIAMVREKNLTAYSVDYFDKDICGGGPWINLDGRSGLPLVNANPIEVKSLWKVPDVEPGVTRTYALRFYAKDAYQVKEYCNIFNVGLEGIVITPLPQQHMATNRIKYDLSDSGRISVQVFRVYNEGAITSPASFAQPSNAQIIKNIISQQDQPRGINQVFWNGTNDSGSDVSDSSGSVIYYYLITAINDAYVSTFAFGRVTKTQVPKILSLNVNPGNYAISFQTNKAISSADMKIANGKNAEVRSFTLADASQGANYVYTINWDGKNRYGQTIENDTYTVFLVVRDNIGNEAEKNSQFTGGQTKPVLTASSPTYKRTDPIANNGGINWEPGANMLIGKSRNGTSSDDNDVRNLLNPNGAAFIKTVTVSNFYEIARNNEGASKTFEWDGRTRNPANQSVKIDHGTGQYEFTGLNAQNQIIGRESKNLFGDATPPDFSINTGSGSDLSATIQTTAQYEYLRNYILSVYDGDQNLMARVSSVGNNDIWTGTAQLPIRQWKQQIRSIDWTSAGKGINLVTNSYRFEMQGEDIAGNVSTKAFDVTHTIPYSPIDNGAIIISDDGKAELRIPPGSVQGGYGYDDFGVVTRTAGNVIPLTGPPPSGLYFLDRAYDFTPSGVQFNEDRPPILRMYFDYVYVNGQVRVLVNGIPINGGPEVLAFYYYNETDGTWERIGAAPSVENLGKPNERRYLSAPLYHLSHYALFAPTDTTPPAAAISTPSALVETGDIFTVTGTASDANIKEYILKFGFGENPSSWLILKTGTNSISNGTLGTWDARELSGEYTLSLTVQDRSGNVSTARRVYRFAMPGGDVVPGGNDTDVTPPSISGLSVSSPFISPAGNGPVHSVTCNYQISENAFVTVKIVDTGGRVVKTLQNRVLKMKGQNTITWNGESDVGGYADSATIRFLIEAEDGSANTGTTTSAQVIVDSQPPAFSNHSPSPDSVSPVLKPVISVNVTDGYSGVNSGAFQVMLNGQAVYNFTYSLGILSFTPLSNISGGDNTVFVSVKDNAGNTDTESWTFKGDVTPPQISSLTDAPDPFSPSESIGVKDDIYIDADIVEPYGFTWSLTIKDSAGSALKTFSGQEAPSSDNAPFHLQSKWNGYFNRLNEFNEYDLAFASEGIYTYQLTAIDTAGNSSQQSGSFEIDDTKPAVSAAQKNQEFISPITSPEVQDSITITAALTEKNPDKWEIAFFNSENHMVFSRQTGISQQNIADYPVSFTWTGIGDGVHRPASPVSDDEYSFTIGGYDKAGNFAFETGTFILDNTLPVPNPGSDFSIDEGSGAVFDASASTDNLSGIRSYAWDLDGNGDYETHSATATRIYPDDAIINAGLLVEDNAGNSDSRTVKVTVLNVPPSVDAGAENREIQYSDTISFTGNHTDPGVLDTHVYNWDFGDGTDHDIGPYPENKDTTHRYFVPSGLYTMILTVTDDDGGTGVDLVYVKVLKEDTTIAYSGELSKQYSDVVNLRATLAEIDNEAGDLGNKLITWTIGTQKASARTNSEGFAETTLKINQKPGTYTVETDFAGDDYYLPSHDSDAFVILKENLVMTMQDVVADYWGTASGEHGDVVTSRMTVVDEDGSVILPLAGEPLPLQLDYSPVSLGSTPIAIEPTAESFGAATLTFNVPFESEGIYTTTLSFFGNDWFNPASTTAKLTIQDSHPPKVELTYPNRNNCGICRLVSGTVKIVGSANDTYADEELLPVYPSSPDKFDSYKLEYSSEWDAVEFVGPTAGITTDSTTFILSSGGLAPGDEIIFGAGAGENAVYDALVYTVASISGNEITVSPDIQQPTIDTVGASPDIYKDAGTWTIIHESSTAVTNGVLAEWDTTAVPEGNYTLKLTAFEEERIDGVTKPNVSFTTANVTVVRPETDVLSKALYGGQGNGIDEFNHPAYIAVDQSGNMYVTDRNNDRIQKITPDGAFSILLDTGLNKPEGVAVDSEGNVYVADGNNDRVVKISPDGSVAEFASGFNKTKGVAVDNNGYIYISDGNNDKVYKYSPSGTRLLEIPIIGGCDLNKPAALDVDTQNNIYVTDRNNDRVLKYDQNGNQLLEIGASGQGQLNKPEGVVVNEQGYIYVSDTNTSRVIKYDPLGNFVLQLGVPGNGTGQFNKPGGLALFGCDEKLYVVDQNNARVQVYGAEGLFGNQPVVISNLYNYPDPFDAVRGTTVFFNLSKDVPVELKIYDASGELVRDLTAGLVPNGLSFSANWDAKNDTGQPVTGGEYTVKVIAVDEGRQITESLMIYLIN